MQKINHIEAGTCSINELPNQLSIYLETKFGFPLEQTRALLNQRFLTFKTDINVYYEYPYVDKLYRNTYYNYFSTKHKNYLRDCVRISFFNEKVDLNKLTSLTLKDEDDHKCYGFICIRPTFPNFFGRGLISPECLKWHEFQSYYLETDILISNKRFKIKGFPFASQDAEYMKCAETAIWETLQYFGGKYEDYKMALPSDIVKALSKYSFERQTPSPGLSPEQISFALKEFGFGVRIYHRIAYERGYFPSSPPYKDFHRILHYYIESGIPVICVLSNSHKKHAVLYVGYQPPHAHINFENIEQIDLLINNLDGTSSTLKVSEYSDLVKKYVIIDDNKPPYQIGNFGFANRSDSGYLSYYQDDNDDDFKNLELVSYIVPLHSKVYLPASQARQFIYSILKKYPICKSENQPVFLRLFLTTSRSFKRWITSENDIDSSVKAIVVATTMPKFIYVAQLSNTDLVKDNNAFGFIIIDATHANALSIDNLIFIWHPEVISYFDNHGKFAINKKKQIFNKFKQYENY